jgi:hypothetical protein
MLGHFSKEDDDDLEFGSSTKMQKHLFLNKGAAVSGTSDPLLERKF